MDSASNSPDAPVYLTAADLGRRLGVSQDAVKLWWRGKRGPGNFPTPNGYAGEKKKDPLWLPARFDEIKSWVDTKEDLPRPGRPKGSHPFGAQTREQEPRTSP